MADEPKMKSAYELAMERLRSEDAKSGVMPHRALTAKQKAAIARIRAEATSKLAELEILHRKHLDAAAAEGDPAKLQEIEAHYQTDRRRVESALESKLARLRSKD